MLLYYLITCLSFILFLKSLALKPLPPWAYDMRLLSLSFWKDLPFFSITRFINNTCFASSMKVKPNKSKVHDLDSDKDMDMGMSILDLPDLALECILQKLPPAELCGMAAVCTSLRDWCISDHLWEGHMKQKWNRLIGPAAHREWQWHIASLKDSTNLKLLSTRKGFGFLRFLSLVWPFRSSSSPSMVEMSSNRIRHNKTYFPLDSTLSWYVALETGKFWFPAQVYNRENGHVGFMLSCYDAELSYDSLTDTFQARYPPHGRRAVAIESGVSWERLRAPPTDTPAHDLHISDCLNELRPGDHIEIQWRRNKEFPYGWWYGVVGHLESCDGNANYCLCHNSDSVTLEFNQYAPGSRWRCTTISRKDHREEGNEAAGFYGGIRKLKNDVEINTWKRLWPTEVLD